MKGSKTMIYAGPSGRTTYIRKKAASPGEKILFTGTQSASAGGRRAKPAALKRKPGKRPAA